MTQTVRQRRGQMNFHAGTAAENRVAQDYERRGLALAQRRWRGKAGEIDLILRDGPDVIFVEVKHSRDFARAAQSLSQKQIKRLFGAAEEFLANEPQGSLTNIRFDVALVDGTGKTEIIENAFGHG